MLEQIVDATGTETAEPLYPLNELYETPIVIGSASLVSGGFVTLSQTVGSNSVFVTLFAADGSQIGAPIAISAAGNNQAAITALSTGGFAVGWIDFFSSPSVSVHAQSFDAAGAALGAAFTVAQSSTFSPRITSFDLAGTPTGGIAVSWNLGDPFGQHSTGDIYATVVSATGAVITAPVALHTGNDLETRDVDVLADGRVLLTYTDQLAQSTAAANVGVAVFDPAHGTIAKDLIKIVPTTGTNPLQLNTTVLASGNLLVSWTEYASATNQYNFRGEIFSPTGLLLSDSFNKTYPGHGTDVVALANGGFVIAFGSGPAASYGIAAQVFDASGTPVNDATIVSDDNQLNPTLPILTTFGTGDVALSWNFHPLASAPNSVIKLFYSTIPGTGTDDHIVGTADADIIYGLAGNDLIEGQGGDDILFGGSGDDQLFGGAGSDQLFGGDGNDQLDGGLGNDELDGGAGDDVLTASGASGTFLMGGAGNDHLIADNGRYELYGDDPDNGATSGDDIITLTNGATGSSASGGGGNDIIDLSGTGDIYAEGGDGDDRITIDGFSSGLINLGGGKDLLHLPGGDFDITFFGGNSEVVLTNAAPGSMTLIGFSAGSAGDRLDLSVFGSDPFGAGTLTMRQQGPDVLIDNGATGLHIVIRDVLVANLSDFNLGVPNSAYAPVDLTVEGAFATFPAVDFPDVLIGADGNDTLFGYGGDDRLFGAGGNDVLHGGLGADYMVGGTGNDTYDVDNSGDVVVELAGQGVDQVKATIDYTLTANVENLDMSGGTQALGTGNDLDNVIVGNARNNVLSGGLGNDTISGGAGADTFRDTLAGHAGDTITDFSFGDVLVFSDATQGSFSFSLTGNTLTYSGGSLTLANLPTGTLAASAAVGGGVQLVLAAPVNTGPIFGPAGAPLVANFNPANGWANQNLYPRHVADMNGDGYADIVGFGQGGVLVSYGSAGGSFSQAGLVLGNFGQSAGWSSDNQFHRVLADVNGDGRADILGFGYAGVLVSLAKPDGSFTAVTTGLANFGSDQAWTSQDGFARLVGDVNGDGKADVVGFGYAGALVSLGNGDGTFQGVNTGIANFGVNQGWTSDNSYHRELADVNGDGRADLIGFGIAGTYVALSNGDGTFANAKLVLNDFGANQGWSNNDGFARVVADVNGDHIADIVGFGSAGTLIALGKGDGTFQPVRFDVTDFGRAQGWNSDSINHREVVDINHDGFADVVGFGSAGVLAGLNHPGFVF